MKNITKCSESLKNTENIDIVLSVINELITEGNKDGTNSKTIVVTDQTNILGLVN